MTQIKKDNRGARPKEFKNKRGNVRICYANIDMLNAGFNEGDNDKFKFAIERFIESNDRRILLKYKY